MGSSAGPPAPRPDDMARPPVSHTNAFEAIRAQAEKDVAAASSVKHLEEIRVRYLGRKSELTTALRSIGDLPPEERGKVGQSANAAREALEALIGGRTRELEDAELNASLSEDR